MTLLSDPQAWVSFLTLTVLEIVLGFDNILFLVILVDRLPIAQRRSGRVLGLAFAMLTRIALLFSITWIATMRKPLIAVFGHPITGRDLILFAGGAFLIVKSIMEIRETLAGVVVKERPGVLNRFWMIIAQIGVTDIAFSLDTVFTAVGLASHIEVMVAAIVVSALVMMGVSSAVGDFIGRHPTTKLLALAFLILVGGELIGESLHVEVPKAYLWFAISFSAVVEWLNLRLRPGRAPRA